MNKHELDKMEELQRKADEKIPAYEKKIKALECQIKDLERGIDRTNPDVIFAMQKAMQDLYSKFPKVKFEIKSDFGRSNTTTFKTTDVCPI